MPRLELRAFEAADLDAAASLLAGRHTVHRGCEPLLDPRYENPAAAATEIAALWDDAHVSGAFASDGGRAAGFLLGVPSANAVWGPNIWVTAAGAAVSTPETIRDLYGFAAQRWADEGRTAHYAMVPATDAGLIDAWFRLGFGQQHVHAVRETPVVAPAAAIREIAIRRADVDDIPVLAALDLLLPEHQGRSPVFSSLSVPTLAEAVTEWEESIEDQAFTTWVAERDGVVVGSAVGCDVRESGGTVGLIRPAHAADLGFAAVVPNARGAGVGRALGEAFLAWAAQAGFPAVATDWRATNLLSSRAWPRLGFRPSFLRLHRIIGY
ncbi:MAG: GNAT family N-acetyltransferase [Pseudonocardiales bacterium]